MAITENRFGLAFSVGFPCRGTAKRCDWCCVRSYLLVSAPLCHGAWGTSDAPGARRAWSSHCGQGARLISVGFRHSASQAEPSAPASCEITRGSQSKETSFSRAGAVAEYFTVLSCRYWLRAVILPSLISAGCRGIGSMRISSVHEGLSAHNCHCLQYH